MTLVEETADYLDGDGRHAARELPRPASIVYATESMRLTTRLMQLASWLLLAPLGARGRHDGGARPRGEEEDPAGEASPPT